MPIDFYTYPYNKFNRRKHHPHPITNVSEANTFEFRHRSQVCCVCLSFLRHLNVLYDSGINARVTLLAPPGNSSQPQPPPAFVVNVKTFSGPVNLDITHDKLTPSSALQVQVQNDMAQSTIALDAKFQGAFSLLTKLGQISIGDFLQSQRDDPTGGNRTRTLVYDQIYVNKASGWVGWGPRVSAPQGMQGYLDVASSLSPITLNFGS